MNAHHRVRIKRADLEIEVESPDKDYVDRKLEEILSDLAQRPLPSRLSTSPETPASGKQLTLPEFVKMLGAKSNQDRALGIAYFLEKHDAKTALRTPHITAGFKTIRVKCANPSDVVAKLKSKGLLMRGPESGSFIVSSTGEQDIKERLPTDES